MIAKWLINQIISNNNANCNLIWVIYRIVDPPVFAENGYSDRFFALFSRLSSF